MKTQLCLALLGAAVMAGPALADKPDFVADGTLAVCTTATFPPLTYKTDPADARPVGIDIDLIEAIGRHWGAEVDYTVTEFSGLLPTLGSGRCDIIASGIYVTDKRREVYDGVRYMKSATVIVTRADDTAIQGPDDLSGKTLALEAGTYYGEERVEPLNAKLADAGAAQVAVQEYPTQLAAYQQVLVGRADATLTEEAEGAFRVASQEDALRIAYTWPSEFTYGLYIQKSPENVAALREALQGLRDAGFFEELAKTYGLDPAIFDVDYDS